MPYHLDTDFLVYAITQSGAERERLLRLAESAEQVSISAVAWYEFARGPRTPAQLAAARSFFASEGIIPLSEELSMIAAEVFRTLGSPRKRAADIAIGVTAAALAATLVTRNAADFEDIPNLAIEAHGK